MTKITTVHEDISELIETLSPGARYVTIKAAKSELDDTRLICAKFLSNAGNICVLRAMFDAHSGDRVATWISYISPPGCGTVCGGGM
jgi:hypothetical protein